MSTPEKEETTAVEGAKEIKEAKEAQGAKEVKEAEEAQGAKEMEENKEVKETDGAKAKVTREKEVKTPKSKKKKAAPKASTPKVPKGPATKPTLKSVKRSAAEAAEEENDAKKTKVKELVTKIETKVVKEKKDFVFSESMLDEFDTSRIPFSTDDTMILMGKNVIEKMEESIVIDEEEDEDEGEHENDVEKLRMMKRIKELEAGIENLETAATVMKDDMEEKEKIWKDKEIMAMGTINSLEVEKEEIQAKLDKYRRSVPGMVLELNNLREELAEPKNEKGTAKGEVNKLKKALKDMSEKLEEVTKEKTKFESEARRMHGVCDNQEELLKHYRGAKGAAATETSPAAPSIAAPTPSTPAAEGSSDKEKKEKKTKCFRFEKGLCSKEQCRMFHPTIVCKEFSERGICGKRDCMELHTGTHKGDCWFWKQGSCKYDEKECGKGLHRTEMFDCNNQMRAGERRRSPPAITPATTPASFFEGGQSTVLSELHRRAVARGWVQEVAPPAQEAASVREDEEMKTLVMKLLTEPSLQGRRSWGGQ